MLADREDVKELLVPGQGVVERKEAPACADRDDRDELLVPGQGEVSVVEMGCPESKGALFCAGTAELAESLAAVDALLTLGGC